ncbi:hypothetical protein tpqmel_0122 [Candidatus Gastranaerophilus sp. (ex Termes propinquus)]|nr:hypothetical protein tpqmel_0122 [Candidatus Gastranaerophilus sp. (ex Termes propinquus)]
MFCPKCRKKSKESANFCSKCGCRLDINTETFEKFELDWDKENSGFFQKARKTILTAVVVTIALAALFGIFFALKSAIQKAPKTEYSAAFDEDAPFNILSISTIKAEGTNFVAHSTYGCLIKPLMDCEVGDYECTREKLTACKGDDLAEDFDEYFISKQAYELTRRLEGYFNKNAENEYGKIFPAYQILSYEHDKEYWTSLYKLLGEESANYSPGWLYYSHRDCKYEGSNVAICMAKQLQTTYAQGYSDLIKESVPEGYAEMFFGCKDFTKELYSLSDDLLSVKDCVVKALNKKF